jgi:hypothetical protein
LFLHQLRPLPGPRIRFLLFRRSRRRSLPHHRSAHLFVKIVFVKIGFAKIALEKIAPPFPGHRFWD